MCVLIARLGNTILIMVSGNALLVAQGNTTRTLDRCHLVTAWSVIRGTIIHLLAKHRVWLVVLAGTIRTTDPRLQMIASLAELERTMRMRGSVIVTIAQLEHPTQARDLICHLLVLCVLLASTSIRLVRRNATAAVLASTIQIGVRLHRLIVNGAHLGSTIARKVKHPVTIAWLGDTSQVLERMSLMIV